MKKIITHSSIKSLVIIFLVSLFSSSCTKEDKIFDSTTLNELLTAKTWECVSIIEKHTNNIVYSCLSDDKLEFLEDNVCNIYSGNIVCEMNQLAMYAGTYEISEDEKSLELLFNGYQLFEYEIYEAGEEELILEHILDGKEVLSKFEPEN